MTCRREDQAPCVEQLAGGWITASDLCGPCTGQFIAALEWVHGEPLTWHRNYLDRAEAVR